MASASVEEVLVAPPPVHSSALATNGVNGVDPTMPLLDLTSVHFDQINADDASAQLSSAIEDFGGASKIVDIIQSVTNNAEAVYSQNGESLKAELLSGESSSSSSGKSSQEENINHGGNSSQEGVRKVEDEKPYIKSLFEGDDSNNNGYEEEIELEFQQAAQEVHNHNSVYCPNCKAQITKVIVRRRRIPIIQQEPARNQQPRDVDGDDGDREQALGCLSCFRIFTPSSNGKNLRPVPFFGNGGGNVQTPEALEQPLLPGNDLQNDQGSGCNPFAIFRTRNGVKPVADPGTSLPISDKPHTVLTISREPAESEENPRTETGTSRLPSGIVDEPERQSTVTQSFSPEIVKSIVYGGLAESITSLGLVSSAAASGATTLNIVALGVANLIGGLFIIGQNLLDLKKDQQEERYKEALGRKEHFLWHVTFVILSYLKFGLIPPVVYGFTFQDTDNKDYKLLAVAAASLTCVVFLAIGKAYSVQGQQRHKFSTYLKTVLFYVTTAVMASGVAYAAGDQAKKLLEKYGWLEPSQASNAFITGGQTSPDLISFASY